MEDILTLILTNVVLPYDAHNFMAASQQFYSLTQNWRAENWSLGSRILKPYQVSVRDKMTNEYHFVVPEERELMMLAMCVENDNTIIVIDKENKDYWMQLIGELDLWESAPGHVFTVFHDEPLVESESEEYIVGDEAFNPHYDDDSSDSEETVRKTVSFDNSLINIVCYPLFYPMDVNENRINVITDSKLLYTNKEHIAHFRDRSSSGIKIVKNNMNRITIEHIDELDETKIPNIIRGIMETTDSLAIFSSSRLILPTEFKIVYGKNSNIERKNNKRKEITLFNTNEDKTYVSFSTIIIVNNRSYKVKTSVDSDLRIIHLSTNIYQVVMRTFKEDSSNSIIPKNQFSKAINTLLAFGIDFFELNNIEKNIVLGCKFNDEMMLKWLNNDDVILNRFSEEQVKLMIQC
jgi:hypothetical protein